MKIKFMLFVLAGGIMLASCSDKAAEQKIADLEKAMHVADSTCAAEKTMLMDSIMTMQKAMESMTAVRNTTSSTTTTKSTTTTTPKVGEGKLAPSKTEVGTKTGDTKKVDIKTKGGATGGN